MTVPAASDSRRHALAWAGLAVLSMVLFTVVKSGLRLHGAALAYPYAVAGILFCLAIPALPRVLRSPGMPRLIPLALLFLAASSIMLYHVIVLGEEPYDVLYTLRFYFGIFILFYGLAAFLFSIDPGAAAVQRWIRGLTAAVLILSFVMAAVEYVGLRTGLAGPQVFWWVREVDVDDIMMYQREGITTAIRAYGLASNPAVLAGFTAFLAAYFYSLSKRPLPRSTLAVLVCAVATILMTKSGTGMFLLVAASAFYLLKDFGSRLPKARLLMLASFAAVAAAAVLPQLRPTGRLSADYWMMFSFYFRATWRAFWEILPARPLNPLYGALTLYSAYKPGSDPSLWAIAPRASFYDFSLLAMVLDIGLVGVWAYLLFLGYLVLRAFPKDETGVRWSFLVFVAAMLHYPAPFWMCSQAMAAAILASHVYIRHRSEAP